MSFKHRIWLLPIMTAVIAGIGIAVGSQVTSRTSLLMVSLIVGTRCRRK